MVDLNLKVMVPSGDTDPQSLELLGEKTLGHKWMPNEDKLVFTVPVNLSINKRSGQCQRENLTVADILKLPDVPFTKRMLLGFIMSQYDPMGLICPLIVILKIMLRRLYGPDTTGASQVLGGCSCHVLGDGRYCPG